MTKNILVSLAYIVLLTINSYGQAVDPNKVDPAIAIKHLDRSFAHYDGLQKQIWSDPELGFLETRSSAILQKDLLKNNFKVQANVAGMPTAFVASYGSGSPVIAVLAEFDALPGLSQDTVPYRKALLNGGSGHACGHNVFGVGAVAGAIAIKQWLEANKHQGTIRVYGTPAEEGGGGKVYLVRDGFFKDVDVVLDWHPATKNGVSVGTGTAIKMIDYSFYGVTAHAAGDPHNGRSALDGVEAMNYMVNLLREHVPISSRIHYVITNGGEAPNVVPDFAKVSYYIRSPQREILKDLEEWVGQAAEGAAKGTQTRVESEVISGFYERLNNRKLAELVQSKLEIVGGVVYNNRERIFAEAIVAGLQKDTSILRDAIEIQPLAIEKPSYGGGSSDVGDISWNVPTVSFVTATFVPGSAGHSWQNAASGGTTIGTKSLINTAKVFALSAIELYTQPQLLQEVKDEFISRRGANFEYTPLLGKRAPALDYRLKK